MAKCIMIQGTMSGVGKSLLTAAFCRIFHQKGYRTAPFKSQNMALNSAVTEDGLEIGRAQAMQAQAAGRQPDVRMNPILLKPTGNMSSQLIVGGRVRGQYDAASYFRMKKSLIPEILDAYNSLAAENDIIVIEGAGSPAEINLRQDDIVNMGLAELVDAPVILTGDIDRGGVFAQLYGTVALLREEERRRLVGMLINKFRGDVALLRPGLPILEEKTGLPVLGVVPYLPVDLDDEDSLAQRLERKTTDKPIDIAVIRLPRISNFTDFAPLERHPSLGVRYVSGVRNLGTPDLVILPGTKNTVADLLWLRAAGLEKAILQLAHGGTPVWGICGGYQMLGETLSDPFGLEHPGTVEGENRILPQGENVAAASEYAGLGLLPCHTVFEPEKRRTLVSARVASGPFAGTKLQGYEIHMGRTRRVGGSPFAVLDDGKEDGAVSHKLACSACGEVFGTYLHGLFDSGELTDAVASWLLAQKGMQASDPGRGSSISHSAWQEQQFDLLAEGVEKAVDLDRICRAMGL